VAKTVGVFFALSTLLISSADAQNLILNGGFESPVIPSNTRQTVVPTSWQGGGFTNMINGQDIDPFRPVAIEGEQQVAIATSEPFSQAFTVTIGGEYLLRWLDSTSHEPGAATAPYSIEILSQGAQPIAAGNFDAFHTDAWVERSLSADLAPGDFTLRFLATGGGGPGDLAPGIDGVSMVAIPEPQTWVLALLGLLLVAGLGRRPLRMFSTTEL
jgi:hypothetical protein